MLRTRLARLVAPLLALLALPAVASAAPKNLLLNPGFEEALTGHEWMPAGWDTSISGLPTVFFGRDTFLVRSGEWSANLASVSDLIPMNHNWSQIVLVGREAWGKDLVFSVWTRSNGVDGRAYALVQVYRDTVSKMARTWNVDRETALSRLGVARADDDAYDLGWSREVFSAGETDWVKREVRVYCPPSVNCVFVRVGLFGTGQVLLDDASLTIENPKPAKAPKPGTDLLAGRGGFESGLDPFELAMPPFDGMRVEIDSTVAHGGRASVYSESGTGYFVETRAGVGAVLSNRALAGQRLRLSGYVRTDSLKSYAYCVLYAHTVRGVIQIPQPETFSATNDWTFTSHEMDLPADTYSVWAWFTYLAPNPGRVWFDDLRLEVVGRARDPMSLPPRVPGR